MTQQEDRWFNIVKTIDKLETDHFELFNTQHEEMEKAVEKLGYKGKGSEKWSAYDPFADCGSTGYYKELEDGRIIRVRISIFSNICEYCHNKSSDLWRIQEHIPQVLCKECRDKIDTNEIKLTGVNTGELVLDPNVDNSCDRCHNQFKNTELNRTCYQGQQDDEYLCGPCLEIVNGGNGK